MKKHHWHVFQHEKLFEKQPLSHCQTRWCKKVVEGLSVKDVVVGV
jgi:hypothetical protein